MSVSVILPAYNEKHNIVPLICEILKYLPQNSECIVIDDNSPDGTGKLVNSKFSKNSRVLCFIRKKERSLGAAIAYGIGKAQKQSIVIMDSDFNHQPKYLPLFIKHLDKYDLVCGSRYVKGGGMPETPLRFLGSFIFNLYIRFLLQICLKDSLSGFVAIKKLTLNKLTKNERKIIFQGFGEWYIRLLWWAKKEELKIKEIPVQYGFRLGDESKMNFAKSIMDYTKTVLELKFKGQ